MGKNCFSSITNNDSITPNFKVSNQIVQIYDIVKISKHFWRSLLFEGDKKNKNNVTNHNKFEDVLSLVTTVLIYC